MAAPACVRARRREVWWRRERLQMFKSAMLAIALAAVSAFAAAPASAAESVYIIRHLQKAAGDDPALTPQGAAGAQALAELLGNRRIQAVFATPTRRAIQTGTPLAVRLGLPVTRYDPADAAALVQAARDIPGNILVIGHSNTVPDLVAQFGGARPGPLTEQDYGTIYLVETETKEVREIALKSAAK